jgi:hypothetical protein
LVVGGLQGISSAYAGFGSLPEQSVRAVHETAVTVLSGTHSELRVFPNHFVPERGTTYFDGGQPAPETPGESHDNTFGNM